MPIELFAIASSGLALVIIVMMVATRAGSERAGKQRDTDGSN